MQEEELLKPPQSLDPVTRPSRLPLWLHLTVIALLFLAFISGGLAWFGEINNAGQEEPTWNVGLWRTLHGILNPFLCIIFGYLLAQHIRAGWEMRANWVSGAVMEAIFAALILTGIGLYYAPESWHNLVINTHRIIGLLLPISLIAHWICSRRWLKTLEK